MLDRSSTMPRKRGFYIPILAAASLKARWGEWRGKQRAALHRGHSQLVAHQIHWHFPRHACSGQGIPLLNCAYVPLPNHGTSLCCLPPDQVIPDDVAKEKADLLRRLGAEIEAVRPRGIVDPKHVSGSLGRKLHVHAFHAIPHLQFVNEARRRAEAFGNTELIGPHAREEGANAGLIPGWDGERRDDLVLTTNAHVGEGTGGVDEVENLPRGFFADQVSSETGDPTAYFWPLTRPVAV